jgi:hypothetical protein
MYILTLLPIHQRAPECIEKMLITSEKKFFRYRPLYYICISNFNNHMKIQFERSIQEAHPKDIMSFVECITGDYRFRKKKTIWVISTETKESDTDTMVNVTFTFQSWDAKQKNGYGTKYTFRNYRAKSFSCMNMQFSEVPQTETK